MTWRGLKRLRRPANGHGSLVSSTTKLSRPVIVSLCAHPARSNLVSGDPTPRCRFRRSLGLICQGKSPCNAGDIYAAMSQRSCRVRRNDGRYFALSQGHICSASCPISESRNKAFLALFRNRNATIAKRHFDLSASNSLVALHHAWHGVLQHGFAVGQLHRFQRRC